MNNNNMSSVSTDFERFITNFLKYISINLCNCIDKECLIKQKRDEKDLIGYPALPKLDAFLLSFKLEKRNECNFLNLKGMTDNTIFKNEQDFLSYSIQHYNKHTFGDIEELCTPSDSYCFTLDYVLQKFIEFGLLRKLNINNKPVFYILDTDKEFTWNNVKDINIDIANRLNNDIKNVLMMKFSENDSQQLDLILKCLFWYFRKFIIDSIVISLINRVSKSGEFVGISVGSTFLSSDYDITLYSKLRTLGSMIYYIDKRIELLMGRSSTHLFDTNIYGISFIVFESNKNEDFITSPIKQCKNEKFSYLQSSNVEPSQHVWAFAKLLSNIYKLKIDDEIVSNFSAFLNSLSYKKYIVLANYIINETIDVVGMNEVYSKIIHSYDNFKKMYAKSEINTPKIETPSLFSNEIVSPILKNGIDPRINENFNEFRDNLLIIADDDSINLSIFQNNFVSMVNYFGNETYFTRGAFLDVVVNNQMCQKDNLVAILLSEHEYIDSFIENMSELIIHPSKIKYLDRAELALGHLQNRNYKSIVQDDILELNRMIKSTGAPLNVVLKIISTVFNKFIENNPQETSEKYLSIFNILIEDVKIKISRSEMLYIPLDELALDSAISSPNK